MARALFRIPVKPARAQTFRVTLSGVTYTFELAWNPLGSGTWVLDIYDESGQQPILRGLPLVTGADLLEQYQYLPVAAAGSLVVQTRGPGHSPDEVPSFINFGVDGHLYYLTRN